MTVTDGPDAFSDCDALLALGSNIGDKAGNIQRALDLIADQSVRVVRRSRNYRTPPWGKLDQDWFVNACVAVATDLSPEGLLAVCQSVEKEMGRVRKEHWGPRLIDVDILAYRGAVRSTPELTLPHPRIAERAFVLVPLADIAPGLAVEGRTVREWKETIERSGVEPLAGD